MRLALLFFVLSMSSASGSESDVDTYSQVPLKDAAPEINAQVNESFQRILQRIQNPESREGRRQLTDAEFEHAFAKEYNSFRESYWMSVFEACIQSNRCPGWGPVDRVVLRKGESVYAQTHFSPVTEDFLAPVINLCGVRMGADKLTHMFEDGFRLYDLSMRRSSRLSDQDLIAMSLEEEHHLMGKNFTGVVSYGDVYANLAGVRLFRDLLVNGKFLDRDDFGSVTLKREIDICEYVRPEFDERVSPTRFHGEQARELVELLRKKRRAPDPVTAAQAEGILCRDARIEITSVEFIEGVKAILAHPVLTYQTASHFPAEVNELSDRRPVNLFQPVEYPEAETLNFLKLCEAAGKSLNYCGCALGNIRYRLSFAEFRALDQRFVQGRVSDADRRLVLEVFSSCGGSSVTSSR